VVFLAASAGRIQIGERYILPIYPYLAVMAASAVGFVLARPAARLFLAAALAAHAGPALLATPRGHLTYFNALAGGPARGHRVLLDSNLDWGQDLKGLKRWMDDHRVPSIQFLYFGSVDPEYYGIDATYIPGNWVHWDPPATQTNTPPRYIAISVHLLYTDWRDAYVRPYRQKTPVASIGHSIHIFEREDHGG
jgi:hypothetical protein